MCTSKNTKSQISIGSSTKGTKTTAGPGAKGKKKIATDTESESATSFWETAHWRSQSCLCTRQ